MKARTYSSELEELTTLIDDLVVDLNLKWRLHHELFQVDDHHLLLEESGAGVWSVLSDALIENVFMAASRLFDSAASCGKPNLSFGQIIERLPSNSAHTQIKEDYLRVKALYDSTLKDWRNWKLSHNSLDLVKGNLALPDVALAEVAKLVNDVTALARSLGLVIRNIDQRHIPVILNQDWVPTLTRVLRGGIKHRSR